MTTDASATDPLPGTTGTAPGDGRGVPFLPWDDDATGATDLARELRRVRGLVAGSRFDDVHDAVTTVRELADHLEAVGTMVRPSDYVTWGVPEHLASNPAIGSRNPVSPPLEPMVLPDATVRADLRLGIEYQGPPGCVHGGIVALIFDEMLGLANAAAKSVGMTADLRVIYTSPTPLDAPLRFEARQERVEGRKIWSSATLYTGETLCARAEALFIEPRGISDAQRDRPVEG
ncbi:PaaI family thioesterase [Dietzia sp. SYD-A1]|uniref:PaaI family thioesterase n=1 Tax=Dietzia sp. SYD-A1 TaxID=2780141 RepID=UPI001890E674|nr:PaaI family thioesterase [Dietzia sp. SYD-A1]